MLIVLIAATTSGPPFLGSKNENIVTSAVKEDGFEAGNVTREDEDANAAEKTDNRSKDYPASDETQLYKSGLGFMDLVEEGDPIRTATSPTRLARDTPIARTQNSRLSPGAEERRCILLAEEVSKCSVGPLDAKVFLKEFLPPPVRDMPGSKGTFDRVPKNPKVEKKIYEPLVLLSLTDW